MVYSSKATQYSRSSQQTYVKDFRVGVDWGFRALSFYKDWPADEVQAFGRSQIDIIESELEIAKNLLLVSNANTAVVYTRGFEINGTLEPVIVIGVDGEFDYPSDARLRPCRIHIDGGVWLSTCNSFSVPTRLLIAMNDPPACGDPISVLRADDGETSEPLTIGAVVFGYDRRAVAPTPRPLSNNKNAQDAEPDSVYILTCGHHLSSNSFSIGTSNDTAGDTSLQLVSPSSSSLLRGVEKEISLAREALGLQENAMVAARTYLIDVARTNGVDPCVDIFTEDRMLPLSLQGANRVVGDAWLQLRRIRGSMTNTQENITRKTQMLELIINAPKSRPFGYARAAELGLVERVAQVQSSSIAPISAQLTSSTPLDVPFTYLDTALFKITNPLIADKMKKAKSPFLPNHGKVEKDMQVDMRSWGWSAPPDVKKSNVDRRAFFVSRTPAYLPKSKKEGLHVLDNGKVVIVGEKAQARYTLPRAGISGAVVYAEHPPDSTGLLCPVALCVGVFSLCRTEEKIFLVLPLSDVIPHLEAAVQQDLLFSPGMIDASAA